MNNKLAYLCSSVSWGGLEMNHLRNAKWMQNRGHEVVVLGIENSPFEKRAKEMNLPFIPIPQYRKYYDFKASKTLLSLVKEHQISHLLIRDTKDMSMAAIIKRKLRKNITTAYFMEMQLGVKKKGISHTLRYKYIDIWSCPLNWLKEQVESMTKFKNKLVEIPSGIELEQFKSKKTKQEARQALNISEKGTIFGLIGRFDPQKGQMLLVEALEKAKNKNFKILLLGEPTKGEEGAYHNELNQLIKKHADRIIVRPFRKDIQTFYQAIDWLVMATKSETVGMVTIESLASGKPVLGSNAGGTPEIINQHEGGILFESMNANDLAAKIDYIQTTHFDYRPEKLRQLVSKFDHHLVCSKVEKVLNIQPTT